MDAPLKGNQLVFAGPFLGEFGWELSHWVPHVRWLRQHYKNHWIIVASYPGRDPLYRGVANEFYPLPEWFLKEKYDVDCYEALAPEHIYGKLLKHFENKYQSDGSFSSIIATRTPRGFNHILRQMNHVVFGELISSDQANMVCKKLIQENGNKPCVILFARAVNRKMFLDIKRNQPVSIEHIPGGLPTRNWPRSHWEDLFDMLYEKYHKHITFIIGGTKHGNCLLSKASQYKGIIDLTEFDISESLDVTIAFLKNALCSISSQSGPTHLSLQTKCPSFIYGHEAERHAVKDNPFKTDVVFFETKLDKYNEPPELLFNDASVYIDMLMQEKNISQQPKKVVPPIGGIKLFEEPVKPAEIKSFGTPRSRIQNKSDIKEIKSIAVIGVFDVKGSTNIPLANAFDKTNVWKYNYRTELANNGAEKRDADLIHISKRVDLMIFCKGNGIDPNIYEECSKNTYTCWFMMDSVQHLSNQDFYDYARICDFSVVTTKAMQNEIKKADRGFGNKKIHHIIQPIDPKEFYPVEVDKKYDVVFIGTRSDKRDRIIEKINEWGFSIKTYGNGYGKYVTGEDFNRACCEGKICLAINNTDGNIDSFSDRMIRYMATKSCVMAEYSDGLENYFDDRTDLVCFKDLDRLEDDLLFLRKRQDISRIIAANGYNKVIKNHTWGNFASRVLEITKGLIDGK